ncbi:MAG: hypothetical protein OXU63_14295 [Acidobacteriota bacterium]|nr:hypothetical protein [Acidobacteriota bacterium]
MRVLPLEERVEGGNRAQVALGLDDELPDPGLVQAQVEQGVVEFPRQEERPEGRAPGECFRRVARRRFGRTEHGQTGGAQLAVELDA